MNARIEDQWEVALRGIERFYDEGMRVWTKENFFLLFDSVDTACSDFVNERLRQLEKRGAIVFRRTEEAYIEVINI